MNQMSILLQLWVSTDVPLITIILFWVVLAVLIVLFVFFLQRTNRIIKQRESASVASVAPVDVMSKEVNTDDVHEEEAAAIALAIHLYQSQMHDMESFTITMQKVSRIYSPWSSKIYTLRQNPRLK